jgi:hypothetical protein
MLTAGNVLRVSNSVNEPVSVKFVAPAPLESGTKRATSVSQMYDIVSDSELFDFSYDVGIRPTESRHRVVIRNNCVEHSLSLGIVLPLFITLVPLGKILGYNDNRALVAYTIEPQTTVSVQIAFTEEFAKEKSATSEKKLHDVVRFIVNPLNVQSPVLVKTNLPELSI